MFTVRNGSWLMTDADENYFSCLCVFSFSFSVCLLVLWTKKEYDYKHPFCVCVRFGVDCQTVESSADTVVPAYSDTRRHCIFQSDLLLFSCAGAHQSLRRICPCRDYMKGQVALCKNCL